MNRRPPTVETVKEGLAKIDRSLTQLKNEIRSLYERITPLKARLKRSFAIVPPEDSGTAGFGERPETDEPRSALWAAITNLEVSNPEPAIGLLTALAKDIDGALRDIRAMRTTVEAISDDADLRNEFKKWLG